VIPAVRRAVAEIEPSLPVTQVETVDQSLSRQVEAPRDSMVLVGTFGVVALLLAVFGIYGVVAYGVAQRAHEIGIRIALGATSRRIVSFVLKQAVLIVSAGLLLGLVGSFALTRFLAAVLWEVTPTDPLTFAGVALLLTAIALLASLIPTRRALRMQPAVVLHSE
jgi:ABC-type antimicrobial peptide transport system permease subunit